MSILVIGDSFSALDPNYVVWPSILGQRVGKQVYNHATPGSGYFAPGVGATPNRFSRQIIKHADITNPADIELVIVFGSCNDRTAANDALRANVFTTHREITFNFPQAKQLIVAPQWSGPTAIPAEIGILRNIILDQMWGYDWKNALLDPNPGSDTSQWWFPPNRTDLWQADQFHPNQLGHTHIADQIEPPVRSILGL